MIEAWIRVIQYPPYSFRDARKTPGFLPEDTNVRFRRFHLLILEDESYASLSYGNGNYSVFLWKNNEENTTRFFLKHPSMRK